MGRCFHLLRYGSIRQDRDPQMQAAKAASDAMHSCRFAYAVWAIDTDR